MVAPAVVATVAKVAPKVLQVAKTVGPKVLEVAKTVGPKVANAAKTVGPKVANAAKSIMSNPEVKDMAGKTFNALAKNPTQGSVFDALNKVGINNTGDLKAGIDMLKEDPKGTLKVFGQDLIEKKFVPNFQGGLGGIA